MYLEDYIRKINTKLMKLTNKKHIVIWGAAETTVRLFQYSDILKYNILDIVDKNKADRMFFGKVLKRPCDVEWKYVDAVVISSFCYEDEIENELRTLYCFEGTVIKLNEIGASVPFYAHLSRENLLIPEEFSSEVQKNRKFKNIHTGKRIFILCCGPSIKQMDLKVLKNEITMAVHSFYLHKDIEIIRPTYYCNAPWDYGEKVSKALHLQYLEETKKYVGDSQYFFAVQDKEIIEESKAFIPQEVSYYCYGDFSYLYEEIDFCRGIMPVQSVAILCIQLALYMGFKEIYLLGTEHNTLTNMQYSHFYDYNQDFLSERINETDEKGNLLGTYSVQLKNIHRLWEQYNVLKKIAEEKGVKIYNATLGGVLDVFERVEFKTLF